jgi:tagatose 1,6-diphosphate aldolase
MKTEDILCDTRAELTMDAPVNPGELTDGELRLVLDRFAMHPAHKVPTYYFQMVHVETGKQLGHANLRIRSTPHVERYAGHVGYLVEPEHRGHKYAARSVRLLIPLALRLGLNPLWMTCDPDNFASRRTMELVGARFIEVVDVPKDCAMYDEEQPSKCRYRLNLEGGAG